MLENLLFCCVQGDPSFLIFNEIRGAADRCKLRHHGRNARKVTGLETLFHPALRQSRRK
jgi:hypothetical protein